MKITNPYISKMLFTFLRARWLLAAKINNNVLRHLRFSFLNDCVETAKSQSQFTVPLN
jgi:hypothetical protein